MGVGGGVSGEFDLIHQNYYFLLPLGYPHAKFQNNPVIFY